MSDRNVAEDDFDNEEEFEDLEPEAVPTVYLKSIAKDGFNTPLETLAENMGIPKGEADAIIRKLVQEMVGTHTESNFPKRILQRYNRYAPQPEDELTVEDIVILMKLIDKYIQKLTPKQMNRIEEKMKKLGKTDDNQIAGRDPRQEAIPVPDIPVQPAHRITYTDTRGTPQSPPSTIGQAPAQQTPAQGDQYSPYESEESLMKFFLENNYGVREPQRIYNFMQMFRMNKANFLANPMSLLVALKGVFGDRVAEATLQMFMDARSKLPNTAGSLYKITGASNYTPIIDPNSYLAQQNPALSQFMNFGQAGMGIGGPQPVDPHQMMGGGDVFDRELQRLSKIIGMQMMQQMYKSQMAGMGGNTQQQGGAQDPNLYDYIDHYDQNTGRFIKREWIRKGFGYGPSPQQTNPSDKTSELMMKFMEVMMTKGDDMNKLLMQKVLSGDQGGMNSIIETVLKQAVGAMTQQIDPSVALTKYLDLGEKVASLKQQPQKSVEEKRLEMDFLLAKQEMVAKEAEKQREFQRQQDEANNADQRYSDTVKEVGNIIKEGLGPAVEIFKNTLGRGLGGNMPGMFPAGYPQQQPQPQPERVVVHQVEPQMQPQYTPEQIRLLQQQEQMRRAQMAQAQAQYQAQQQQQEQEDNRPLEEVLTELPDDQLDEMAARFEGDLVKIEHMGNKVLAERARRKGHGYTPRRNHVAPVVQAAYNHEQAQAQAQAQAQQYAPEEESINVFEEKNTNPTSNAVDFSDSYNDENIREAMKIDGTLSENDEQNEEYINENQTLGVPASTSMPPTQQRVAPAPAPVEEEPVVEIDESYDTSDTVIE